jgi:Rieske Fe-S protein
MHSIPRRRFVKGLFLGTAFSSIVGKSWSSAYAATSTPASSAGVFEIKVSDFPALLGEIGSVRLGVSPVISQFPASRYYPVIINRDSEGFYVLNSECKHASCVVAPFDTGNFGMRCPCHQSLYDIRGIPLEGPDGNPPETIDPLDPFEFEFDGADKLKVFVPMMAFNIRIFQPDPRLKLEFVAEGGVSYEVRFREKLTDQWQITSFSRTPDGPADEQLLVGNGDPNTIYVDRATPTGFYAVSMVLNEV